MRVEAIKTIPYPAPDPEAVAIVEEALATMFCEASGWPADDPVLLKYATRELRRRKSILDTLLWTSPLPGVADPGAEVDRRAQELVRTGIDYGVAVNRVLAADPQLASRYINRGR